MFKYLNCVGVDGYLHSYIPGENKCLCGTGIKQKLNNLTPKVIQKYQYWCGICDYNSDDVEEQVMPDKVYTWRKLNKSGGSNKKPPTEFWKSDGSSDNIFNSEEEAIAAVDWEYMSGRGNFILLTVYSGSL